MTILSDGTNFDFWLNGQVLYLTIVLIANLKIIQNFNVYNLIGEVTVFSMIFNFLWFYVLESSMPSIPQLYRTLPHFFSAGSQMWLCTIFCVGYIFTMDRIVTYVWRYAHSQWKLSRRSKRLKRLHLLPSGPTDQREYSEFNDEKQ